MRHNKVKPRPKIGFCAAFEQGFDLLTFAVMQQAEIDFVATCITDDSKYPSKIIDLCNEYEINTIDKISGNEDFFVSYLSDHNIDIVVLLWWPSLIKGDSISSTNVGWINLHPTLLPYGRGKHGFFWSIVERSF